MRECLYIEREYSSMNNVKHRIQFVFIIALLVRVNVDSYNYSTVVSMTYPQIMCRYEFGGSYFCIAWWMFDVIHRESSACSIHLFHIFLDVSVVDDVMHSHKPVCFLASKKVYGSY